MVSKKLSSNLLLCVITILVFPDKFFNVLNIISSFVSSKDDVASSTIIISLLKYNDLAIANLCFCPPESNDPFSPT